ncbi:MAG: phenylphosphate carboxylase subunit gamma [Ardenticatenia bacterium]|nr:phenylphosphate carboxylase subunit gamma [Ardenticatenia bacterium]
MRVWEVFVNDLSELREDEELDLSIRTLAPGIHKYTYKRVRARVSASPEAYPDRLHVRFGRGQPCDQLFSIQILEELDVIPAKYL